MKIPRDDLEIRRRDFGRSVGSTDEEVVDKEKSYRNFIVFLSNVPKGWQAVFTLHILHQIASIVIRINGTTRDANRAVGGARMSQRVVSC